MRSVVVSLKKDIVYVTIKKNWNTEDKREKSNQMNERRFIKKKKKTEKKTIEK
jgi:hypothetical protein